MINTSLKTKRFYLIICTLIVGACSIMYELLISTVASYFLGDSILQFSLTIGVYLAAMGLGSYLYRFINSGVFAFIVVELLLGTIGALSIPILYYCFTIVPIQDFNYLIFGTVGIIGLLTGYEIPLLTDLLNETNDDANNLSDVLTYDYIGALVSTILFPFLFLPVLGTFKTSIIFGSINLLMGLLTSILYKKELKREKGISIRVIFAVILIINASLLWFSHSILTNWNQRIYSQPVIYDYQSPYQNIVFTKSPSGFALYLDRVIQFNSIDEYRYHETLVHVPIAGMEPPKKVLILGGGEGLAVREVLKYSSVEKVDLVELDPKIVELSKNWAPLVALNEASLLNEKVTVHTEDAFVYMLKNVEKYDLVIADLPDPSNENLSRLYTDLFYAKIKSSLNYNGIFVTQATNPSLNKKTYNSIRKTIEHIGFHSSYAFKVYVPSFGEWGFIAAGLKNLSFSNPKISELSYINNEIISSLFAFSEDMSVDTSRLEINRFDRPILYQYYLEELALLFHQENKI